MNNQDKPNPALRLATAREGTIMLSSTVSWKEMVQVGGTPTKKRYQDPVLEHSLKFMLPLRGSKRPYA